MTQRGPTFEELGTCPALMVMADPYPCRRVGNWPRAARPKHINRR